MSVTTISGSIGIRDGRGDIIGVSSNRSSNSSSLRTSTNSSRAQTQQQPQPTTTTNNNININNTNNTDSGRMVGDKINLPPTPGGGGASNSSVGAGSGGGTPSGQTEPSTPSSNHPKVYGKIVLNLDNVMLEKDKFADTPSCLDGMDPEMEWETRVVGCELISSAGILLKLPQVIYCFLMNYF